MAAVLVWEVEHVGSVALSLAIAAGGLTVGVIVSRRLHDDLEQLADHYEALLKTADEESRKAESASRAKDEFLATLSHELRTPLNSILGWARLLGGGKLDADQTARAIAAIERGGWAQSRLIEDLLDLSRIVNGTLRISTQPTLVQSVVDESLTSLQPAADAKHLTISTSIDSRLQPMWVDSDRLRQVVWNLVSNAIKFTPPSGAIDVSLGAVDDTLRLVVRDTGIGFGADVAEHLFERFHQGDSSTTREHGGLGLGLGIVRHIVELHGGTVSASSAGAHAGATFEVRLPIRRAEEPTAKAPPAPLPSLRDVSVLVLDDDGHALELVRSALEPCGAKVITASTVAEASERFARYGPDGTNVIDVIIGDVMLAGGSDGVAFIRDVRRAESRTGRHTPAIALTALARTEDRRRTLTAGYDMHLAKPVDPYELAAVVSRLAHRRLDDEAAAS